MSFVAPVFAERAPKMASEPVPPFETVTADDRSAQVTIPNCILIVFSGIIVLARAFARLRITGLTKSDDLTILLTLGLAIVQTVCTQLAVNHGLGVRRALVRTEDFVQYSKYNYASQLLAVPSMACAKIAVSQLVLAIEPKLPLRYTCYTLEAIIAMWAVTSVFALAFQCDLPHPWIMVNGRCLNLRAVYGYVGALNIFTDVVLTVLPIPLLWSIHMRISKKILVIGLFGSRLLVPAATIVLLICVNLYLDRLDRDQTWDNTIPALLGQIVMNLSIITACIPSLRRMVTDLRTDQTGLKVTENMELSLAGGTEFSSHGHSKGSRSAGTRVQPTIDDSSRSRWKRSNVGRQSSEEHLTHEGITHTIEYSVEEDDGESLPSRKTLAQTA